MSDSHSSESDEVNAPVHIEPYDTAWPERFATEASAIGQTIGPWITGGIHHVGSTAVPGLAAKPVIDIMVGVADLGSSRPCIELLKPLDYCYWPYLAEVMHWFCKPRPSHRTHHLHLVPTGSPLYSTSWRFGTTYEPILTPVPTTKHSSESWPTATHTTVRRTPRARRTSSAS